jgi:hypothetical protein
MLRVMLPIFIVLCFSMIISVALGKMLHAIYFSQLEIIVFMGFMYYELKNK